MAVIAVGSFQPFVSRRGVDTVLSLRFGYNAELIETLKSSLRTVRAGSRRKNPGGWLSDHKVWFVERWAWPAVRWQLEKEGHHFTGSVGDMDDGDGAGADEPRSNQERAERAAAPDWSRIIRQWLHEMALEFHPDRGGHVEAMKAINIAADRLKELTGTTS